MAELRPKYKILLRPAWEPGSLVPHKLWLLTDSITVLKRKMLRKLKLPREDPQNFLFSFTFLYNTFFLSCEEDLYFFLGNHIQHSTEPLIIDVAPARQSKKTLLAQSIEPENRPSGPFFDDPDREVQCAFCRESSTDESLVADLGVFLGPFKVEGKENYCHERCAIWTPDVYLNIENRLVNIEKEIKRARKFQCSYCGLSGAGLGCVWKGCKKTYHFKCSLQEDLECALDYKNFTLYCPEHITHAPSYSKELVYEEIFCETCGKGDDDENLLICEVCSKGFHTFCLKERLEKVPDEDWVCEDCR